MKSSHCGLIQLDGVDESAGITPHQGDLGSFYGYIGYCFNGNSQIGLCYCWDIIDVITDYGFSLPFRLKLSNFCSFLLGKDFCQHSGNSQVLGNGESEFQKAFLTRRQNTKTRVEDSIPRLLTFYLFFFEFILDSSSCFSRRQIGQDGAETN